MSSKVIAAGLAVLAPLAGCRGREASRQGGARASVPDSVRAAPPVRAGRSPRDALEGLPAISSADQCSDGVCDHDVEARVFGTLDSLGTAVLGRGMSIGRVRGLLGGPPDRYMAPASFRDARYGHRVDIWTYALSLSGTYEYYLAFIDGCLDDFGRMQVGRLFAVYGRSGHTSEAVKDRDYRPGKGSGPTCPG
ncbi:MAG TPA: hypothetical protein VKA44_08445 [Gemmatimonadota bacterium]|nr:hypothetical protein [Gemmatimonadota bacterium]